MMEEIKKKDFEQQLALQAFEVLEKEWRINQPALKQVLSLNVDRRLKANLILTVLTGG